MQKYPHLGKTLQIGRLTVKNRFCMAPIGGGQHHLPGGRLKDETIQYLVERAKGGFGLIFTRAIAADSTVDPYTGVGPAILQNLDAFKMSHRTDEYGGSLENRLRAAKEILEGIKRECGRDFPVSMRLGLMLITD